VEILAISKAKKVLRTMTVKFIDSKIKYHFYGSHEAYYIILFPIQYQYLCNFTFIFFLSKNNDGAYIINYSEMYYKGINNNKKKFCFKNNVKNSDEN